MTHEPRQAFLMGVSTYSEGIPQLPVTQQDVLEMKEALEESSYVVTCCEADSGRISKTQLLKFFLQSLRNAKQDATLVLYFSGHGIRYKGKDYLVSSDIELEYEEVFESSIQPIETILNAVDKSPASRILFFICACREGIEWRTKSINELQPLREKDLERMQRTKLAVFFACEPGQKAHYEEAKNGEAPFSLFTRAVTQVLSTSHPATTIKEVIEGLQPKLDALAEQYGKERQVVTLRIDHLTNAFLNFAICDSAGGFVSKGNPWLDAVSNARLWKYKKWLDDPELTGRADTLQEKVRAIIAKLHERWTAMAKAVPCDPWRDELLPCRIVRELVKLLSISEVNELFLPEEIALLVLSPFVREALVADGVLAYFSKAAPYELNAGSLSSGLRNRLETSHRLTPQLVRKAKRLANLGKQEKSQAVAMWLLYRALFRDPELWTDNGLARNTLRIIAAEVETFPDKLSKDLFSQNRLVNLARCLFTHTERLERGERLNALQNECYLLCDDYDCPIREKVVAHILLIGGALAIDTRVGSDVLATHLGLSNEPDLAALHQALNNKAQWTGGHTFRSFKLTTDNAVIDFALREHIARGDDLCIDLHQRIRDKEPNIACLAGFPSRLTDDKLVPAKGKDGASLFTLPHTRFHLDVDNIRELLMGEQLYGDPSLAIRELYQNALDACRYRQMRLRYLELAKQLGTPPPWSGLITFTQGRDEDGRPYVECTDNGIGMGRMELESCFARAGRRFADTPEFIEEQAEWLRFSQEHDLKKDEELRLYPNSQFGVGVFSYFMLSDELEIETRRMEKNGHPGKRFIVTISSSGSLFNIAEFGEHEQGENKQQCGTRVRLYLKDELYKKDFREKRTTNVVEVLQDILKRAEFEVQANYGASSEYWRPFELKHEGKIAPTSSPDVWWSTREENKILVDGIVTSNSSKYYILDLRNEHKPKLSVDRKKILNLDTSLALDKLQESVDSLIDANILHFEMLHGFDGYIGLQDCITLGIIERGLILCDAYRWSYNIAIFGATKLDALAYEILHSDTYTDKYNDMQKDFFTSQIIPNRTLFNIRTHFLFDTKQIGELEYIFYWMEEISSNVNLPPLLPSDVHLLHDKTFVASENGRIGINLSISDIVHMSNKTNYTIKRILKRIDIFKIYCDVIVPQADWDAFALYRAQESDIFFLVGNLHPWKEFVRYAYKMQKTIRQAYERAAYLQPLFGYVLPQLEQCTGDHQMPPNVCAIPELADWIPDETDYDILSPFGGDSSVFSLEEIEIMSEYSNKAPTKILERARFFEQLGFITIVDGVGELDGD